MNVFQIIVIGYFILNIIFGFILHGKPKTGEYDAFDTFVTNMILALVLYAGGFWK